MRRTLITLIAIGAVAVLLRRRSRKWRLPGAERQGRIREQPRRLVGHRFRER